MSTQTQAQTGQGRPAADTPPAAMRQEPQTLISESIRYRRRAQDAERRAEALEAEIAGLRQADAERAAARDADLAAARTEAEGLRSRLADVERERTLERELAKAGCADTETALALARTRLAAGPAPDDLGAFARSLLEEKPHLAAASSAAHAPARPAGLPPLPPRTSAPKAASDAAPVRAAERLAGKARESGRTADVLAYMRARRGVVA